MRPSFPRRLFNRRVLARISITVTFGLSSMKIGASARRPTPWLIFFQSASVNLPSRTFLESTRDSEHKSRCDSSSWLISSENTTTGRSDSMAACAAMPSANEVLPMAGRAPATVHQRLGLIHGLDHIVGFRVRDIGDVVGHADEAAQRGVFLHDAGVAAHAGDGGRRRLEIDDDAGAAEALEEGGAVEDLRDGYRV